MTDEKPISHCNITGLPARVTRPRAADLVTERYFEVSQRTLERWPLNWRLVNGKSHCEVAELFLSRSKCWLQVRSGRHQTAAANP